MRWRLVTAWWGILVALPLFAQDRVPVRVAMPQQKALSQQLVLSGSLTAQQDASLSSRSAGLVAEVLVDAGSVVTRGQPLLQLDTTLAQHELAQRQAALNAAKVQQAEAQRLVNEAQQLTAQQLFAQTELSLRQATLARVEAELQQAAAALALQQEMLARHTLTAPFAGVIAKRYTDAGEWLALGTPVLQLVSLTPLLLDVQVPQEYFGALACVLMSRQSKHLVPVCWPWYRWAMSVPAVFLPGCRWSINSNAYCRVALPVPRCISSEMTPACWWCRLMPCCAILTVTSVYLVSGITPHSGTMCA
jgi:biotin carboxyl carrier protein